MHSQLYRNVLNAHSWMQNCVAFNTLYNDTGLVGIIASADSHFAGQSVDVLCKEMLVCFLFTFGPPRMSSNLTIIGVRACKFRNVAANP